MQDLSDILWDLGVSDEEAGQEVGLWEREGGLAFDIGAVARDRSRPNRAGGGRPGGTGGLRRARCRRRSCKEGRGQRQKQESKNQ